MIVADSVTSNDITETFENSLPNEFLNAVVSENNPTTNPLYAAINKTSKMEAKNNLNTKSLSSCAAEFN